jgi:glycosyltransferase involved in cell wall biosynthesis
MTISPEPSITVSSTRSPVRLHTAVGLDERWRAESARAQEAVLPAGRVVVSCGAQLGSGGLGRHLAEIMDALERRGQEAVCMSAATRGDPSPGAPRELGVRLATRLAAPWTRFAPAWRIWAVRAEYDSYAARRLPAGEHLIAFIRQAAAQFAAARAAGYRSMSMMSASPHVRRVARQHALAHAQYPLERSFGTHILRRYLSEYEQADRIYAASRYTLESFLEQGFSEDRLAIFPLTPAPRYNSQQRARTADTFDVVYVGSLSVAKGVALLIDAVRALPHPDLRLILIGSWKSPGMRRFVQRACAEDPRIVVAPGDPLPYLRTAGVCVHPTFEDGFAYAPAEALACGVPAIVSEDTGMKDLIDPGVNGLILPTGDRAVLSEAIAAVYGQEILSG